jgi:hypothetical protein
MTWPRVDGRDVPLLRQTPEKGLGGVAVLGRLGAELGEDPPPGGDGEELGDRSVPEPSGRGALLGPVDVEQRSWAGAVVQAGRVDDPGADGREAVQHGVGVGEHGSGGLRLGCRRSQRSVAAALLIADVVLVLVSARGC